MRTLKFRAYNKVKKEWMWPYPKGFHIIGEVTVFECLKQGHIGIEQYNDLEIMQYTGLKDKDGVEIYEGDYCDLYYFDAEEHHEYRVKWHHGGFCFQSTEDIHCMEMPKYYSTNKGLKYGKWAWFEVGVIGNIYDGLKEQK